MTMHPEIMSHIDATLDRVGSAVPPSDLEARVYERLAHPPARFSFSVIRYVSAGALAASVALSALLLNPTVRMMVFPAHSLPSVPAGAGADAAGTRSPHIATPASGGGFSTSSVIHVPVQPVPVQPTPLNQGRGHSRSGRALLPNGTLAPLPRGVASPHALKPQAPVNEPAPQ